MFLETWRLALFNLSTNKVRAALTVLGIAIGISAVVTLLSIGQGFQDFVVGQFMDLGTNLIFTIPTAFSAGQGGPGAGDTFSDIPSSLTEPDAYAEQEDPTTSGEVERAVPVVRIEADATYRGESTSVNLTASTPDIASVRNLAVVTGRFLTEADMSARANVAVLGPSVVDDLFAPDVNPVGQVIRVEDVPFRVIGVLEERGGTGFGNADETVYVPLSTAQGRLVGMRDTSGTRTVTMIIAQTYTEDEMEPARLGIVDILRLRHRIRSDQDDDFAVFTQNDLLGTLNYITSAITTFLAIIAGISLLVGGIGIMNIMLVSVTERTREIGLRKAVGARRRDILGQFLAEAVMLAVFGGILGILMGVTGTLAMASQLEGVEAMVYPGDVILATLFSAFVGLVSGIYPAMRAAALHPIDALRYE
jgi:putative ABC transport system permease protein